MRKAYYTIDQCKQMIRFAANYKWWHPKYWTRSAEECGYMKLRWLKELRRAVIDKPRLGKIMTDRVSGKKTMITSVTYDVRGDYYYGVQEYMCNGN